MRINYLTLKNYAGIYNGLELNEIEIDFSKCKHKICLIKGDNGSGKSTIMKALNPLPDANTNFIPGLPAYKCIVYSDEYTGILYKIEYFHDITPKGERATAKAHIFEISPAAMIDLNPSGNVTAAKDIIYDKFNLDPCYLSLTQLSSNKRGMADMKPAERKKFVNSILNNVDAYNDMYKVLTKKAIMYKGIIKNLESRLSTIGDIGKLELEIENLKKNVEELESLLNDEKDLKSKAEAVVMTTDPNGILYAEYTNTIAARDSCKTDTINLFNQISHDYSEYGGYTDAMVRTTSNLEVLKQKRTALNTEIATLLTKTEMDTVELNTKRQKLNDINQGESLAYLKKMKNDLQNTFANLKAELAKLNLNGESIPFSKDTMVQCIETLIEVKNRLTEPDFANIEYLVECVSEFSHARTGEISSLSIMKQAEADMEKHKSDLSAYNHMAYEKEMLRQSFEGLLSNRPEGCNIDDCFFIKKAIEAKMDYDNLYNEDYDKLIEETRAKINGDKLVYDKYYAIENGYRELTLLKAKVNGIAGTLKFITTPKYKPAYDFIVNFNYTSDSKVVNTINIFMEYVDFLYNHLYIANLFEEYKNVKNNLISVQSSIDKLESNEQLINTLSEDIVKIQTQLNESCEKSEKNRNAIRIIDKEIVDNENLLKSFQTYKELSEQYAKLEDKLKELNNTVADMAFKQHKTIMAKDTIDKCSKKITEIESELEPLKKRLSDLETSKKLSSSYIEDLKENKKTLEKIEVVKYYTSPTTGIQLVFATIYLSKILEKANWMLGGLFGGAFNILPFVITEDEFRIPIAVQGGLNHDDITSMSSAQVALISMIISISMLSQVSTSMNIIVGDEIDASLDPENRRKFFDILLGLMDMVNASQSILISHNSEYTQNECDVIWLRNKEHITEAGNVIWSFE